MRYVIVGITLININIICIIISLNENCPTTTCHVCHCRKKVCSLSLNKVKCNIIQVTRKLEFNGNKQTNKQVHMHSHIQTATHSFTCEFIQPFLSCLFFPPTFFPLFSLPQTLQTLSFLPPFLPPFSYNALSLPYKSSSAVGPRSFHVPVCRIQNKSRSPIVYCGFRYSIHVSVERENKRGSGKLFQTVEGGREG